MVCTHVRGRTVQYTDTTPQLCFFVAEEVPDVSTCTVRSSKAKLAMGTGSSPPRSPGRREVSSGGPYEDKVGYSRAVRVGAHIYVAGTTATAAADGGKATILHPGDAGAQARVVFATIAKALEGLGAGMVDVVSTRMYVTDPTRDWEAVGAAHAAAFGPAGVRPAATMVGVPALVHPDMLVEIEATAVVAEAKTSG
ncbi:hypothetical protein I4F81_005319 [Pyropia yezoensis]|uniref:Uncharacterized protein n=1 Tax=Pyropia yezoensis TaxID=2788 RepID=A0ACC3BZ05_PYRYE|nr:hypothetical protein I4F81_005319 [Neopyropia yezoensis]